MHLFDTFICHNNVMPLNYLHLGAFLSKYLHTIFIPYRGPQGRSLWILQSPFFPNIYQAYCVIILLKCNRYLTALDFTVCVHRPQQWRNGSHRWSWKRETVRWIIWIKKWDRNSRSVQWSLIWPALYKPQRAPKSPCSLRPIDMDTT